MSSSTYVAAVAKTASVDETEASSFHFAHITKLTIAGAQLA
jgi:hypothetical protein